MNLKGFAPLLDYKYWSNTHPVPLGSSLVAGIFAFFGWFILLALVLWLLSRWLKVGDRLKADIFRRFSGLLFSTGLLGLLVLFLTYEQLPLLGMRFWFLLVAVYFVARLVVTVAYTVRDYPAAKARAAERKRLTKWLPGVKKSGRD
jgi:hypothetical protein